MVKCLVGVAEVYSNPYRFVFVMNATMAPSREDVSFAVVQVFLMRIIARNAALWRKIETAVQRLSIWELRRLTCSMRGKSIVSRKDNTAWAGRPFELNYQSDSCAQYARVVDERAPFFVSHFYRTGLCT